MAILYIPTAEPKLSASGILCPMISTLSLLEIISRRACAFTLADGISLALAEGPQDRLPYTLVCLTGLFFLLHGAYHKRCALRLSCRTAAAAAFFLFHSAFM